MHTESECCLMVFSCSIAHIVHTQNGVKPVQKGEVIQFKQTQHANVQNNNQNLHIMMAVRGFGSHLFTSFQHDLFDVVLCITLLTSLSEVVGLKEDSFLLLLI